MEAIHHKIEELFGILLPVDGPFTIQASTEVPERGRHDNLDVVLPQRPGQVRIESRHYALGSLPILLYITAKSVVDEESAQWNCCAEALDSGIHVARHTEIGQSSPRNFEAI